MIILRKAQDRGLTQTDWLTSWHTFSFGEYHDPEFMGFSYLRVINEDTVQPDGGFGTHPHRDMEIISYVISGKLQHKDSMGTGTIIRPGEIQCMSAGTGVMHSEFNPSSENSVHFLQIWIVPNQMELKPSYQQKQIPQLHNRFILLASPIPNTESVIIHQDVHLYMANLTRDTALSYSLQSGRKSWIQLIKGEIAVNNKFLKAGDGVAIVDEDKIQIQCIKDAELLMFDLGNM